MDLIIFDLDGTLLDAHSKISHYTQETLIMLSERNVAYTVATGRTLHSAQKIIEGHGFHLPHIYSNGVLIWDPKSQMLSMENVLAVDEVQSVLKVITERGITPFLSSVDHNHSHYIYYPKLRHYAEERLLGEFRSRPNLQLLPLEQLPEKADIISISALGAAINIDAIRDYIRHDPNLIAYSGPTVSEQNLKWIDIHHCNATKGGAIAYLKVQLGVKNLLCFGDSDNDLSMFSLADESYAPENAKERIKAAATATIGHHNQDGIARYLRERFEL
jgi:Cof subfamily protein (haloacid dehalogenase superfamily)